MQTFYKKQKDRKILRRQPRAKKAIEKARKTTKENSGGKLRKPIKLIIHKKNRKKRRK